VLLDIEKRGKLGWKEYKGMMIHLRPGACVIQYRAYIPSKVLKEEEPYIVFKDLYILQKEQYILLKEPYILSKQPNIPPTKPYVVFKDPCFLRNGPYTFDEYFAFLIEYRALSTE